MGAQQLGNGLTAFVQNFLPALQALQERQRASKGTALNLQELSGPQQSPVSAMPPMQAAPQPQMQMPQMGAPQQAPPSMPSPMGGSGLAAQIGPLMEMLRGGGSLPGAPVPGGSPSQPGAPQAMGPLGSGPQPAAQPPMAPQQQQQERDPNLSAVAQPTGQGVIADGNANLRAIVTGLRKMDPNASPDTIMRATMERIGMLKGVQPEVKDAMMMQARSAQTEFKYTQLQEQMDRKDSALAEKQRNDDMVNKAKEDAITAAGLRVQMGVDGRYTVARLNEGGRNSRFAKGESGKNDRFNKGEAGKTSRFTQAQADKDRTAGANRDLKRVLGDNVNLTRVAQTYMKSHPSATPEAAAAYAKKIAPPGGANTPSASAPDAEKAWLKSAAKINKSAAVAKYEQRHGKGSAAAVLGGR